MNNIEIIDGIEVDWGKFKSKAKGRNLEKSKETYVELCTMLHDNGHILESEYINNATKVLIAFNCGHEPHGMLLNGYKKSQKCPKCTGLCPEQARENFLKMIEDNGHKLLGRYVNAATKVLVDFNCGHEPNPITPNKYKSVKMCPKCAKNNP